MRHSVLVATLVGLSLPVCANAANTGYLQQNLVSDGAVPALQTDPDLKNPWGISFGASTPFWISDNGTGLSTLYNGIGVKQGLVVTLLPAPGSPAGTKSTPTGTVFNGQTARFMGDRFLFATEDGTIAGWQGGTTAAVRAVTSDAVYKGLAINGDRIYATNFASNRVDVFNSGYAPLSVVGSFTDPNMPSGFAPFGIQSIGNDLYVSYAKQGPGGDDVSGPGNGFVDKYDRDGTLLARLITGIPGDPASPLNSPWGIAMAPAGFGDLSGLLLVGNFGDGKINAFNPTTGAFVETLSDAKHAPIVIDGLWGLAFGNNAAGFDAKKLYFTAGLNGEADGLFGSLAPIPEPATSVTLGAGLLLLLALRRRRG